jgi:hypothetical protein
VTGYSQFFPVSPHSFVRELMINQNLTNMKKIILLTLALLSTLISFAQDLTNTEVPSIVLNTFKQKFPKAVDVEWELKNKVYKVEFETDRQDHEVWINGDGSIVKHKQDLKASDLPKDVTASIALNYKGYRIDDVAKVIAGAKTLYKVELKKGSNELDLFFEPDGKVVEGDFK